MAREVRYRPAAPEDGLASIELSAEKMNAPGILAEQARWYARQFIEEENSLDFHIGISNWSTNRALAFTIEAARLLCCGSQDRRAFQLLCMAIAALKAKA